MILSFSPLSGLVSLKYRKGAITLKKWENFYHVFFVHILAFIWILLILSGLQQEISQWDIYKVNKL